MKILFQWLLIHILKRKQQVQVFLKQKQKKASIFCCQLSNKKTTLWHGMELKKKIILKKCDTKSNQTHDFKNKIHFFIIKKNNYYYWEMQHSHHHHHHHHHLHHLANDDYHHYVQWQKGGFFYFFFHFV